MKLGSRAQALERLASGAEHWDLLIVGGGITGAGILREAARRGLSAVLIEQSDFASGTSSRSSKMVHGGLRYLGQGAVGMTRKAVRERERLLVEAPGLVERMPVAFTLRKGKFPGKRIFMRLLALYDRMAGINDHRFLSVDELREREPGIATDGLSGAAYYTDALTDDARLVLRVLGEAVADGGLALNYIRAERLIERDGRVCGVVARDRNGDREIELRATAVINATGAWADDLRGRVIDEKRMRPLRGSHLIVPFERLPVSDAVTLFHPVDGRPVYAYRWLDATVIGTTDLDHDQSLAAEPSITREEVDYLLAAMTHQFPGVGIGEDDIVSTMAGVRPVIDSGKRKDPSKETREEAIREDRGLVTVSGGKLTTFRPIAMKVLEVVAPLIGAGDLPLDDRPVFTHGASANAVADTPAARRDLLAGRYGAGLADLIAEAGDDDLEPLGGTSYSRAELRFALRHELTEHLDDLLLRRTRIGNLLRRGAAELLDDILELCREELGWDAERAAEERHRYESIVARHYALPA
ncbi:MAG: glycerol-3-phosphate dehydrogenase/oxidase [Thermoleophilia bacterium]|nr:glycerol-3-phosphate dehydrogenase/oxidase [Thermoleophilia bacterium]